MVESDVKESRPLALTRRLLRGGAWVFAGRIVGIGLLFLSNVVLARWLPPADFGRFLLAASAIGFLCVLARFGLDRFVVRFIAEGLATGNSQLIERTLRISFGLVLASTLCVAVLSLAVLGWYDNAIELPITGLLLLVAAIPMFTILSLVAESFRGFHELRYASVFQAQSGPLTTLVFLCALFLAATVQPALPLALGCYVLSVAVILPVAFACLSQTLRRHLPAQGTPTSDTWSSVSVGQTVSLCAPVATSDTLSFLAANAGLWIVAACCAKEDLALFVGARQIALIVALPLNLINLTVASSIPELHAQERLAELQRMLQFTATLAAIPTVSLVLVLVIWPTSILTAVFGSFYGEASQLLVILSLAWLVAAWTGSCLNALLLTGRHNTVLLMNGALVLILFAIGPFIAGTYGAVGIAIFSSAIFAAINLVGWAVAKVKIGVWTHAALTFSRFGVAGP